MGTLSSERQAKYDYLEQQIGPTNIETMQLSNDNELYMVMACNHKWGGHYDHVYLDLYRYYEEMGFIKPGDKVVETTTGTAGVPFAAIGKELGYECFMMIPAGGEKKREEAIRKYLNDDEHLIFTDEKRYVAGMQMALKRFLVKNREDNIFCLNHSRGPYNPETKKCDRNHITVKAMGKMVEALDEAIDYFVPAGGNGSSVLGPVEKLKETNPDIQTIVMEPFQSGLYFEKLFGEDSYKKKFGIDVGTLSRHRLPGTSYQGVYCPHIDELFEKGYIDDVELLSDRITDNEYLKRTGKKLGEDIIRWDADVPEEIEIFGRTTKAGYLVSEREAKGISEKKFLIIAYDKAERYDD